MVPTFAIAAPVASAATSPEYYRENRRFQADQNFRTPGPEANYTGLVKQANSGNAQQAPVKAKLSILRKAVSHLPSRVVLGSTQ